MRQLALIDGLILTTRANAEEAHELVAQLREGGPIIGTDEAGRGALAGPVVAAAVYLTPEQEKELLAMKLRDSKKLTPLSRERLFAKMEELGVLRCTAYGKIELIETVNILQASLLTMKESVENLAEKLPQPPKCVIVDGPERLPGLKLNQWNLIDADNLVSVVSAASIVAKVTRDHLMMELDTKYPEYHFARNKGYPTRKHMETVIELGISEVHRPSFCRKLLALREEEKRCRRLT